MSTPAFAAWVLLTIVVITILVIALDDDDPRFP
jgi:hypothetical protein